VVKVYLLEVLEVAKMLRKFIQAQRIPLISAKTWQGFDELLTLIYEIGCFVEI